MTRAHHSMMWIHLPSYKASLHMWLTCAIAFYADQYNYGDCQEEDCTKDQNHYGHNHTMASYKSSVISRSRMEEEIDTQHVLSTLT